MALSQENQPRWYVLTYVNAASPTKGAQRSVDAFNLAEGTALQLFAPRYVVREQRQGQAVTRQRPLTFHYVFLRGQFADVKRLCAQGRGFAFLLDRAGAERYATIADAQMEGFKMIARAYENSLPYFSLQDVDLEQGDLVEVVNGDFPGLIGRYIPAPKSRSGMVLLQVDHDFATAAFNVRASDVRVLEFAADSRRAYDQIDAFVPRLLSALRLYRQGQPLTKPLIANLTIFCRRMELVTIPDPKLRAKLAAMLAATAHLLGQPTAWPDTSAITNPWTLSLIDLIRGIATDDAALIASGYERISALPPASKTQSLISTEYKLLTPPNA